MAHHPPASSLEHYAPILVLLIFAYNSQMRPDIFASLISLGLIGALFCLVSEFFLTI